MGRTLLCAMVVSGITMPALATTTVTQITYDAGNHVASVTDPRGLVTTYAYDGLGHLWQQVSPDTGTTTFGYDAYGRRSSMSRADNTQTTYGLDALGRTTSVSAGGQFQTFTYDSCTNGVGRLCSLADATGTTSYSYSPEGWLTGRGFSIGGTNYALGYGYNAEGRIASVVYPDGNKAIYNYTRGVVSSVTLNVGGTSVPGASGISYQPMDAGMNGWISSNGLVNTLSYDTDGRLTGMGAGSVMSLGLSYDNADRIIGINNAIDGSMSQNFGYDDESRLVSAYSPTDLESYQYDANGSRTSQTINGAHAIFTISTTSNRLAGVSGAATATYGYDAQGNTTTVNGAAAYGFDAFNRLKTAGTATDYVNPEGVRLRKVSGAGTTYFAPQDGALMAESTSGAWIDYVWLNGRLVGRISGSTVDAVHDDQVGRPQVVTDPSGTVVWLATNYPFEREVALDNISGLNLGFPGQYYDADRQTWNNGYRDYNSNLGRYIESDPLGLVGGLNTYDYVGGNPLSYVDPLGLESFNSTYNPLPPNVQQMGSGSDYYHLSVGYYVGTVSVTLTKNGTLFVGFGAAHGDPKSVTSGKIGFSLTGGKMTGCPKTGEEVDNFIAGASSGVSAFYGIGGGYSMNSAGSATEGGFGTPGASLQAVEYMTPVMQTRFSW